MNQPTTPSAGSAEEAETMEARIAELVHSGKVFQRTTSETANVIVRLFDDAIDSARKEAEGLAWEMALGAIKLKERLDIRKRPWNFDAGNWQGLIGEHDGWNAARQALLAARRSSLGEKGENVCQK